jgi:hypothetical protein
MTEFEMYVAARALISDPNRYCRFAAARDASGESAFALQANAVRWCAIGACRFVSQNAELDGERGTPTLTSVVRAVEPGALSVIHLNDVYGHPAVLKMFDLAIERLKAWGEHPDGTPLTTRPTVPAQEHVLEPA